MKKLTCNQLRKSFIEFFISKKHKFVSSSSVVPQGDPTLLFANAGMNQFKNIFLGLEKPEFPRVANSQKCIRAGGKHNDLEDVGKDGYHHTFFEMLGNWSFADYYKKEAIQWAWEFLTEVLEMPKDKLYATVHTSDQEAFDLWKSCTDINPEHIEYHGDKDNFWEMGATGPCGPCSEIHIDLGEDECNLKGVKSHVCKVNGDCHRFVELWNLVFIQHQRVEDGSLVDLQNKYVDTGAGMERIARVIQGVPSNYDTDVFTPIIARVRGISKVEDDVAFRVIADHIRALTFALADGGMPSNEGRGYVLRRILRRACRFGRVIGLTEPFLFSLVDVVVEAMGEHYTEIGEKQDYIKMIIKSEEERFNKTLDKGLVKFEEIVTSGKDICGADAFLLYDTFGFPLDLTALMAEEKGLKVDLVGFEKCMDEQKQRARDAAKFDQGASELKGDISAVAPSEFVGYEEVSCNSTVLYAEQEDNDEWIVALDKTPFYATSGGQICDTGKIVGANWTLNVKDVSKVGKVILHRGELTGNFAKVGDKVEASIDIDRRAIISTHHTATHILQSVLKKNLGDFVQQKGSQVTEDGLRFDFVCIDKISAEQLQKIENEINEVSRACLPVGTRVMEIEEAKSEGALAFFDDNYGDKVRVVNVGDVSMELCGGTHLVNSGQIGLFKIVSEGSIAAGIRRISAVCAQKALDYCFGKEKLLSDLSGKLGASADKLSEKAESLVQERKSLLKEVESLNDRLISSKLNDLLSDKQAIGDIDVVVGYLPENSDLKKSVPILLDKLGNGLVVLASPKAEKISIGVGVSQDNVQKVKAGDVIREIASVFGGKGGGRPELAFGAGDFPQGEEAEVINLIKKKLAEIL